MTDRLYYNNPHVQAFEAIVTGVAQVAGRVQVILDRTAFYPTSGGQPFDRGSLGPWTVVDVADLDSGDVAHVIDVVDAGAVSVGRTVRGEIDWPRRFDHMQQHTGQHILSATFDRLTQVRTVGFHLGSERGRRELLLDGEGNLLAEEDPLTRRMIHRYDELHRRIETTAP
jgi:alanyl-tRNA synthetase